MDDKELQEMERFFANISKAAEAKKDLAEETVKTAIEAGKGMMQDYKIGTVTDSMLVSLATNAHMRLMHASMKISGVSNSEERADGKIAAWSKEVDRCYRQIFSIIKLLDAHKNPVSKINIKTNTAFVADKQQVNVNNKEPPYESNTP